MSENETTIRNIRRDAGRLTIKQLAREAGVAISTVGMLSAANERLAGKLKSRSFR